MKTPLHTGEGGKAFPNQIDGDFQFHADRDRDQRIGHIVNAGDGQPERSEIRPRKKTRNSEPPLPQADVGRPKIRHMAGMFMEAIGLVAFDHAGKQLTQPLVISAKHGQARRTEPY